MVFNIILGRLEKRTRDGETYFVEKATDVNLALDLVLDAQADEYDEAYLVSNDGDFSSAVKAVIERFGKEITYAAIGNNKTISHHLKNILEDVFVNFSGDPRIIGRVMRNQRHNHQQRQ